MFLIGGPGGGACRLALEHDDRPEAVTGIRAGWALVLSRLRTLLETGESLPVTMAMLPGRGQSFGADLDLAPVREHHPATYPQPGVS